MFLLGDGVVSSEDDTGSADVVDVELVNTGLGGPLYHAAAG